MAFPTRLSMQLRRALPPGVSLFPRPKHKRWIMSCAPDWRQRTLPREIVTCDDAVAYVRRQLEAVGADPGAAMRRRRDVGLTIEECAGKWIGLLEGDERCAPATLKQHRGCLKNWILPRFGQKPIAELDARAVPELRAWLRELRAAHPEGARTILHTVSSFASLVDAALAEGWIRATLPAGDAQVAAWALSAANVLRHPGVRGELPKARDKGPLRLPIPWVQKLLDAPAVELEHRARYGLAGCTGMRDGEIAGVQLRRLARQGAPATVRIEEAVALVGAKGKGGHAKPKAPKTEGSRRTLPVHAACAAAAVEEWIAVGLPRLLGRQPRPEDYLFPRADGRPSRPRSAEQLRADLRAAGLPDNVDGRPIEFKSFRSSFLTWLDEAGVDERVRKRLAGHRASDVTEHHYTVRELAQLGAAVDLIALRWTRGLSTVGPPVERSTGTADAAPGSAAKRAEEKGFEPLVPLRVRRFSKSPASSARSGQSAENPAFCPILTTESSGQGAASGRPSTPPAVQPPIADEQLELPFAAPPAAAAGPGLARVRKPPPPPAELEEVEQLVAAGAAAGAERGGR